MSIKIDELPIIVHTPTQKDYIEVIKWAFNQDIFWASGCKRIDKIRWKCFSNETCIIIMKDVISYCSKIYAKNNLTMDILTIEQFYNFSKSNFANMFGVKYGLR